MAAPSSILRGMDVMMEEKERELRRRGGRWELLMLDQPLVLIAQ